MDARALAKPTRYIALLISVLVVVLGTGVGQVSAGSRGMQSEQPQPELTTGHRWMVVIGIDAYREWPGLRNAVGDATGFARVMQGKLGFSPAGELLNEQASKQAILQLVEDDLRHKLAPEDDLVILFAGHGTTRVDKVGGKEVETGFIVPFDARSGDQWSDYIQVDQLLESVSKLPARHVLVLLDSCYSGFALGRGVDTFRGEVRYQRDLGQRVSRKVISSARRNQLASDKGPLAGHSLFTGALIDGVESGSADLDGDGVITSSELGLYLQQQVGRATASAQTPDFGSFYLDDRGEMLLSLGEPAVSKPTITEQVRDRGPRVAAAFLGFENLSRKPEYEWISTALSEMLRTDLGAGDTIRTISGESVSRARKDLSISNNDSLSRETLSSVYQVLGSDLIISGAYLNVGGTIRIDVRVQNALQGETVGTLSESGAEADFLSVVERLGKALREKCGAGEMSPSQVTAARGSQPGNPEAVRFYSEALDQLRVFAYGKARDLLGKAIAADTGNPILHSTMAQALLELGEDNKAAEEAKRAFDLSHGLERREALLIDAQFREANREWERAVELYRSLWTFFPDDLEYVLKLASAQIAAGTTQEALGTLLAARKLPRPQRDDPRIDLVEASAANSVSDYHRQDQAAKTALDKATRRGVRLLASQALLQQCQAQRRLGELASAEKLGQQAADQFAAAGDLKRQAESLTCVANAFMDQGNYASARDQHEKALSLARQVGAQADIAGALLNLGNVEAMQQRLDQSTQFYQQALAVSAGIGDQPDKLTAQINIADNLMMDGDYASARKMFEQAIETAGVLGDRNRATEARLNLATILFVQGDLVSCQQELDTSFAVSRELGVKHLTAASMRLSGDVFLARGDLQKAEKNYRDALTLRAAIGDKTAIADSSVALAVLALENNKPAESEVLATKAVKEFAEAGDDDQQLVALDVLIQALLAENKLADAQQQIQRARSLHSHDLVGSLAFEITDSRSLAKTGDTTKALEELDRVIEQSSRRQFSYYQLLARAARAETLAIAGAKEAKSTCESVASDATQTGFTLLQKRVLRACSEHGL